MANQEPPLPGTDQAIDPLDTSGRFTLHRELQLKEMFTEREVNLVEQLQALCRDGDGAPYEDIRLALSRGFGGLGAIATALAAYPSLQDRAELGGIVRSGETLMRHLLDSGDHGLEWALPTKALLSRTFGIAKVNFWTSLKFALTPEDPAAAEAGPTPLQTAVRAAIDEAVYTRLAEELYASFVTSKVMDPEVKLAAITQLIQLWEGRVGFATYRFCPVLRSAWAARCRAPRVFGTMMGITEIAILLFQDCDALFVEWFIGRESDSNEVQAFEEFVFDLPFESLERVRQRMREERRDAIGPDEVAQYLGMPKGGMRTLIEDPKALYSSFRTRRVKAKYRTSMRAPGPKRTAESYVLEGLLMAPSGNEESA
jgi:hypothetical protein